MLQFAQKLSMTSNSQKIMGFQMRYVTMLCRGVPASSEVIYVEICEKMSFLLTFLQFHAIMCGLIEISTQYLNSLDNFGTPNCFLDHISHSKLHIFIVQHLYSKVKFLLVFCWPFTLGASYIILKAIKMNFNCVIWGPQISVLHIKPKSDKSHPSPYYPRWAPCAAVKVIVSRRTKTKINELSGLERG